MAELLSTMPGDIPGLLRRGSPVVHLTQRPGLHDVPKTARGLWTPHGPKADEGLVMWDLSSGTRERVEHGVFWALVALDLTDATGRAQAAAWADKATTYNTVEFIQRLEAGMLPSLDERHAMDLGMRFADMTAREIDTLARLCLRLAGRSHV